jgi:hypothetical protein
MAGGVDVPMDMIVKDLTRKVGELAQAAGVHRGAAVDQLPPVAQLVAGYLDATASDQFADLSGPRTLDDRFQGIRDSAQTRGRP